LRSDASAALIMANDMEIAVIKFFMLYVIM